MSFQLFPDFMACAIRAQSSGACAGSDIFCTRAYDINLALRMGTLENRSLIFNQVSAIPFSEFSSSEVTLMSMIFPPSMVSKNTETKSSYNQKLIIDLNAGNIVSCDVFYEQKKD